MTLAEVPSSLHDAIHTVLIDCLSIKADDDVLIVTDTGSGRRRVAEALAAGARRLGAETMLAEISERESDGAEPPAAIAAAMLTSDVVIASTTKSLSHTRARKQANDGGARVATMPGVTEEILVRTMGADYGGIKRRTAALAEILTRGSEVRVTSEGGTDVSFGIRGRGAVSDDGDIREPGAFGNLPAGEVYLAPLEGSTNGRIAFDGAVDPIPGILDEPIIVEVEGGFAEHFSGPKGADWRAIMEPHGKEAFNVAELGIGTNEKARLTGNVIEDEKVMGTIHIAFGDNHTFGGTVEVASHLDGVVTFPTVQIDGRKILDRGRVLI
jgi:leucyl aminopeptidase (aminopeptidase T)